MQGLGAVKDWRRLRPMEKKVDFFTELPGTGGGLVWWAGAGLNLVPIICLHTSESNKFEGKQFCTQHSKPSQSNLKRPHCAA